MNDARKNAYVAVWYDHSVCMFHAPNDDQAIEDFRRAALADCRVCAHLYAIRRAADAVGLLEGTNQPLLAAVTDGEFQSFAMRAKRALSDSRIETLRNLAEDRGWDFRNDYCGRGMNDHCVGLVGPNPDAIIEAAAEHGITGARRDSMGRNFIVYWPTLQP